MTRPFVPARTMQSLTHDDGEIEGFGLGREIKSTMSVCPRCLDKIPAHVRERDGRVWMDKTCPVHGDFAALLAGDARHYFVADPRLERTGSCCGPAKHCGDQVANHSCNMLIEITQRCNLTCPTCYADSSPEREEMLSFDDFTALLDKLLAEGKGDADLVQLSGGEPTLHPRMFDMIEHALDRGIRQIYINTNGIRLARREFAERLATFGKRVSVYLQFDGFKRRTLRLLRGREGLVEVKQTALGLCDELGITTVPVMTLTPDVNDREVGDFLRLASTHPRAVSKVMIQPAMYSGRYDNPRVVERLTVAHVARLIAEQSDGVFTEDDFSPIPCSDPNCFSMALALRTDGALRAVSRFFPRYANWGDPGVSDVVADVTDVFDRADDLGSLLRQLGSSDALKALDEDAVDALLDAIASAQNPDSWGGLFAIGIKPFMDAYTYDQDRIDKCCVHIIATDGTPVSFCEYNAIRRPQGRL